ncbi:glycosyltransferase family protein [Dokdonella sp.]|uniref:glycosyltransferase family protein n=1 Tax=Dokdonella sp. TaxID=2291710 RepID=UPI003AF4B34C
MKILFVGETWLGSCARSLREALARRPDLELDDLSEDAWFPRPTSVWLRVLNRITASAYHRELTRHILDRVSKQPPDVLVAYKGYHLHPELLQLLRTAGIPTVNVYPDNSPHGHGAAHREAVGLYDLVISSKPFHQELWPTVYGYRNRCVYVPQGYDPSLHLLTHAPDRFRFDVVMVATLREQYRDLMIDLAAELGASDISVAVGGKGWETLRKQLPAHWHILGDAKGRYYTSALRLGRICIAPLHREMIVGGTHQPGDVDTTRSYELAAAHCFFIHRRTAFLQTVYDESTEVPMFDNAHELADKIRYYLAHPEERLEMSAAAHARAVPAYSMDQRAEAIVAHLAKLVSVTGRDPEAEGRSLT